MQIFEKLLEKEVQAFIESHLYEDPTSLLLKKSPFPDLSMPDLVEQIQAKRKAQSKVPSWQAVSGLLFPPLLSLEQSSSEETARFKAKLMKGNHLADLTGGWGIDTAFLADSFATVEYVEQNKTLAAIAAHNFRLLGKCHIRVHIADGKEWLQHFSSKVDVIYIDPARRGQNGQKVFCLSDCEPNVLNWLPLLAQKTQQVWIKTSPLLDISAALADLQQAGNGWKVATTVVLAVNNECKEVLYHLQLTDSALPTQIKAVHLTNGNAQTFVFSLAEEHAATATYALPQAFFCEPNAALLKAGAFKILSQRLHMPKLHPHTHLYTTAERPEHFPGRVFRLKAICKANKKAIWSHLPEPKANLAVRNFPASVAELRKRWGIAEGGEIYLFAVTLANQQKAVLIGEKD
ncbi:MAG: class I SAM-dependent methyltransferase [Cytophagales bacterium]|nr:class I SAM-dependent methyltransferase [Bernardetiaceae bacterium]MDW8203526.1 class I SAM-dependent methyltransferase [Cytophagales bacterium]